MKRKNPTKIRFGIMIWAWAALSVGMASCSDFFDPSQDLIQEREDHYNSLEDVRRGLTGAYAGLQKVVDNVVVMGGLRADLMTVTGNYDPFLEQVENHGMSPDNPYASPKYFYDIILNCNDVLENIEKSKADPKMTDEVADAYRAELRTLRAWTYLQLAQTYKEVPVIKEALNGHFGDYEPERYNKVKMLNWLITEMEWISEQEQLDWREFDNKKVELWTPYEVVFINRKALLGELYLASGNFEKAATTFYDCIINDGDGKDDPKLKCSSLTGGIFWDDTWQRVEDGTVGMEHLSVIPFDNRKHQTHGLMSLFSNATQHKYLIKPTEVAVNKWQGQRGHNFNFDVYRGLNKSYAVVSDDTLVNKYMIGKSIYESDAVYPIYRAADLHLLYAEATNRAGNPAEALGVINTQLKGSPETAGIRGRVSLKSVEMDDLRLRYPNAGSEMELVEMALLEERALEFAFEGKRWNDLVRFAERAGRPAWLADRIAAKYATDPSKREEARKMLMDVSKWKIDMPTLK
ncbi:RagB/SusD family nutrient uptake outer membrane protein [Fulvitalea axinellae]